MQKRNLDVTGRWIPSSSSRDFNGDDDDDDNNAVVLSDEPSLSSAALATTLHLVGHSFHPTYTHQCLDGEHYPGYRPLDQVLQERISTTTITQAPVLLPDSFNCSSQLSQSQPQQRLPSVLLHESHRHHENTTMELEVNIRLAPSCDQCQVEILRTPTPMDAIIQKEEDQQEEEEEEEEEEGIISTTTTTDDTAGDLFIKQKKKQKLDSPSSTILVPTATTTTKTTTSVPFSPMSLEDIQRGIGKALPTITTEDCQHHYLKEPLGTILKEYSTTSSSSSTSRSKRNQDQRPQPAQNENDGTTTTSNSTFVITIADGPTVVEYHSQIQKLALWYIENADDVDISEDQSGFWKVLYLFEKHEGSSTTEDDTTSNTTSTARYSLAGYMTLFHFHAPFHKPIPGMIVRICQALIFPPFQGQGHGIQFLQCIYDLAHGSNDDYDHHKGIYQDYEQIPIVQVNVEDPSPGFTSLRNVMDMVFLTQDSHLVWWPDNTILPHAATTVTDLHAYMENLPTRMVLFETLPESVLQEVAVKAKILPRQVQLVYEILCFRTLQDLQTATKTTSESNSRQEEKKVEEWETKFRLLIKRRLNKEYREEMSQYPTKEAKKAYLNQLFEEEIKPYPGWVKKFKTITKR